MKAGVFTAIVFSLFSFSSAQAQPRQILSYAYQNQIFGSHLVIREDGTIDHVEQTCCPPKFDPIDDDKLSEGDLERLLEAIEALDFSDTELVEGGPTTEGGMSGSLVVESKTRRTIVRAIQKGDGTNGKDTIVVNNHRDAAWILGLVLPKVQHKMPSN